MSEPTIEQMIIQLENHLECWKQFHHFMELARARKYNQENEMQFLEIKSMITQELEIILSAIDYGTPTREQVHALLSGVPSLRFFTEMNESAVRSMENEWHKVFINWQSILGQLKVQQQRNRSKVMEVLTFWRKKE
jgi:hypothetical protein